MEQSDNSFEHLRAAKNNKANAWWIINVVKDNAFLAEMLKIMPEGSIIDLEHLNLKKFKHVEDYIIYSQKSKFFSSKSAVCGIEINPRSLEKLIPIISKLDLQMDVYHINIFKDKTCIMSADDFMNESVALFYNHQFDGKWSELKQLGIIDSYEWYR